MGTKSGSEHVPSSRPASDKPLQPPARGVTMTDVARHAGCSQSTVSLVLNGRPEVKISAETRRRVVEAARTLGYLRRGPGGGPRRTAGGREETKSAKDGRNSETAPAGGMSGRDYLGSMRADSHTATVMRDIGVAIVSGRYAQNAILPGDAELLGQFGVSRTVLREAMKTLSGKGLVHATARIGTRVRERAAWNLFDADVLIWHAMAGFDARFLAHLGEMRLALEPNAAALAARRRTCEQIEMLYTCLKRMAVPGVSLRAFVDADLDFHLAVASAAANPFLKSISTLIEVALVAAMTRSWPGAEPRDLAGSIDDHRAIADAIRRGDPEGANAAMRVVVEEGIARSTGKKAPRSRR